MILNDAPRHDGLLSGLANGRCMDLMGSYIHPSDQMKEILDVSLCPQDGFQRKQRPRAWHNILVVPPVKANTAPVLRLHQAFPVRRQNTQVSNSFQHSVLIPALHLGCTYLDLEHAYRGLASNKRKAQTPPYTSPMMTCCWKCYLRRRNVTGSVTISQLNMCISPLPPLSPNVSSTAACTPKVGRSIMQLLGRIHMFLSLGLWFCS